MMKGIKAFFLGLISHFFIKANNERSIGNKANWPEKVDNTEECLQKNFAHFELCEL